MEPTALGISAGAWLWEKYGAKIVSKTAGALQSKWQQVRWDEAADTYRKKFKTLYGTMQIMGMAEPVPLDDIFTDAYMLDKPTAFSRFDIEQLKRLLAEPDPLAAKRINGLRLVVEKGNLFILGKPGAGKTTFLKYIALKAAEQIIDKVPIFISLKQWADSGLELMPFIEQRFDICDFPSAGPFVEELLKSGEGIVLFDGLDEVNEERGQRDQETQAINNFVEKYDGTQCLVTCRIAASDYSFEPFTYVEVADFNEKQIQSFVGNWFRNEVGEKDQRTSAQFLAEFERDDNRGLRDLARTPLLLTLLCLAFNETLTFPQRRVEIYVEALDALLKKWDSSRRIKRDEVYRKLSLGHKENMLARIAAKTFEKNEYFISQSELETLITEYLKNVPPHDTNEETDGETVLKAIEAQHGIFVERAREVYSFSHLTFQEYFTAKHIATSGNKQILTNLVREHCADSRWREVFLLTTSLLPDATQFMEIFRKGVDEFVFEKQQLGNLVAWADRKSKAIKDDEWLSRQAYLSLELWYRSYDMILYLLFTQAQPETQDPNLRLDLALAADLAFTLQIIRIVKERESFAFFKEDFLNSYRLMDKLDLRVFQEQIRPLPSEKFGLAEWAHFEKRFRTALIEHRDMGHEWNLTEYQQTKLENYLKANVLLQECLDLACMLPDAKRSMLNGLYLPVELSATGGSPSPI